MLIYSWAPVQIPHSKSISASLFTPLGIYRVTKTGLFRYGCFQKKGYPKIIMENPVKMDDLGVPLFSETSISETTTWPRLVPEPRCYIPRKGGCSATRSQPLRSDVFQTYLWDVISPVEWVERDGLIDPPRAFPLFPPVFFFNAQVTIKQEMETTSVFTVAKIDKCWGRWRVNRVPNGRTTHKRTGPKCWVFMSKHN